MGSLSQTQNVAAHPRRPLTGRGGLVDKYFYFAMSLLTAVIVVWGFSHTVDQHLVHAAPPRPLILWFHAIAFSTWMGFFIFQSALVRTRNVKLHRFFGWFGAGLGAVMIPLGIMTAIVMARFDIQWRLRPHVDKYAFLITPFHDMAVFAVLLVLAVAWRKKPELHRRIIFMATCCLLSAAFGRFPSIAEHALFYEGVDLVILLGVARDLLVDRRVHRVYLIALPLLAVTQVFAVYTWHTAPGWWVSLAHVVVG